MRSFPAIFAMLILASCETTTTNDQQTPAEPAVASAKRSYFSYQNEKEYTISAKDGTLILDFVATEDTPNIRYNIDGGSWYKVSDDNCTAFRVHVVIEKGRTCKIANDNGLYVSGHSE